MASERTGFGPFLKASREAKQTHDPSDAVLRALSDGPKAFSELVSATGLTATLLMKTLSGLEAAGLVETSDEGPVTLTVEGERTVVALAKS